VVGAEGVERARDGDKSGRGLGGKKDQQRGERIKRPHVNKSACPRT
jgi:hypothetical protein